MDAFKQEIETTLSYLDRIDYNLITDKLNQASTVYLYGTGRAQKKCCGRSSANIINDA